MACIFLSFLVLYIERNIKERESMLDFDENKRVLNQLNEKLKELGESL